MCAATMLLLVGSILIIITLLNKVVQMHRTMQQGQMQGETQLEEMRRQLAVTQREIGDAHRELHETQERLIACKRDVRAWQDYQAFRLSRTWWSSGGRMHREKGRPALAREAKALAHTRC